jgi:hypothetical protein
MFRASLAHLYMALYEHSFGGCSVLLVLIKSTFNYYLQNAIDKCIKLLRVIKLYSDARSAKHYIESAVHFSPQRSKGFVLWYNPMIRISRNIDLISILDLIFDVNRVTGIGSSSAVFNPLTSNDI